MADTSKITLKQLKDAMNKAKDYTDNEIAGVAGVSKVEPEELDMPKVFFYGNALPTTKENVNLTMDYISNTAKFSSFVKLKCQGSSSMSYAKKNFTVAMYSDEARVTKLKKDFKGWGGQSKFCLKANYVDTTHTRNLSGARIAYDMVASRPDSPFKQQLLQCPRNGAVDGFPIKLYFNGEFYGIYTWNIPKDAWMFNMNEDNPNHCVLCAEVNNNGNELMRNACQFRKLWNGNADWSVEVGTASANIKASFDRCINFVMTATDEEFKANIGEYFDLYSLLDYYCFSYLTCHLDGLAKNVLMATYDGIIWGACLYDMDSIYGVSFNGQNYVATNYQCPEQYQETNSLLWQRIESCFSTELYTRYLELRQGALSLSNIVKHVEEIYDVIPDRVFADEKAKWTSLPQVNTNTMTRFRNYMRDRAVYVDAQMQQFAPKVPCTGIVLSSDTLSFTTIDTQTLSIVISPENCTDAVAWSVSPAGIVTVDDGVVTPVTNGTCTITVTCGTQTATCAVDVSGISEGGGEIDGDSVRAYKNDNFSNRDTNEAITKAYIELTSTNYKTRIDEVLRWYPNCTDLYLFDDSSVTTLANMLDNNNTDTKNRIVKVEFMEEYFSTVTNMGNTFKGCTVLTTVSNIPNSVTNINGAFRDCASLTTVSNIPNSVTTMDYTFNSCFKLTTVPNIPDSVTSMSNTFQGCKSLTTSPTIPNSVTNMYAAFNNCILLTECSIPLTKVKNYSSCLSNCSALINITWTGERTTNFSLTTLGAPSYTQADIRDLVTKHLGTVESATLTLGETYLAYLTEDEKTSAVAKGWTLQ